MLFDSLDFKAMESSLSALSAKQQLITQNLANVDTPNYKAKELDFESVLDQKIADTTGAKTDNSKYAFKTTVTESEETYMTTDGNNVDSDKESLELYDTYLQSSYIIQKMNAEFSNYRYVMTQTSFK